ncbi:hypothetical protein [Thiospirillum jenense]|uniref:Uncharacterized protein n=1 Tax=Thiospirillum jenense TaxID=1653858 RepID=A0A839H5C8_9GAMM|nr:hypothetical protein [Thiospirillum jenense]MBB1125175.1 hypothetical protein [Thiospirillum jenense]
MKVKITEVGKCCLINKSKKLDMNLTRYLQLALTQFMSNSIRDDVLQVIKKLVTPAEVIVLITQVESLDDPGAYCSNICDDNVTVAGFFLFIDFVAALIINLGEPAIKDMQKYCNTKHPFVFWLIQYTSDDRFHDEIMLKFNRIFTDWRHNSTLRNLNEC